MSEAVIGTNQSENSRGWRLMHTWDFGWLWWGQVTSQIGEGLNRVALLWFVYELTGSALMMTMIGLLQTIPASGIRPGDRCLSRSPSKRRSWSGSI